MAANSQCLVAQLSVEVFDKDLLLEFSATPLWIGISIQSSGTDTILINLFREIEVTCVLLSRSVLYPSDPGYSCFFHPVKTQNAGNLYVRTIVAVLLVPCG